jgi:hypothetical protein
MWESWSIAFLTEHHAIKAYRRSGGIASRILDLGEWSASRTGRFKPGEIAPSTLDKWLFGPQTRSERRGEEKETPVPVGNRIPVV